MIGVRFVLCCCMCHFGLFLGFMLIFSELPHSLHSEDLEVCVFVKDPASNYEDKLMSAPHVKQVISVEQLRNEYTQYEARRKLLASYDLFLCDRELVLVLRRLLGKTFFRKKKFPLSISLTEKDDFVEQVEHAISCTQFNHGKGSCVYVFYMYLML